MSTRSFAGLLIAVITVMPAFSRASDIQTDRSRILNDLHHSNQMEIMMGKLAKKQGRSDAIKEFGDTLVADHTNADKQVAELAKSQYIELTEAGTSMNDQETKTMNRLRSLHGSAFDLAFARAMVEDHRQDLAKLQDAQISQAGTPLGDLVDNITPVVQKHEDIAIDLVTRLDVAGSLKS